jgi:hypothetical protein
MLFTGGHGWTYHLLCFQASFPDNTYGVDSGGDPTVIPDLTFEQFKVPIFPSSYLVAIKVILCLRFMSMMHHLLESFKFFVCLCWRHDLWSSFMPKVYSGP